MTCGGEQLLHKQGIPNPKGCRLPAGLSGNDGSGSHHRSETLDGASRTDRWATADDVVRYRLGRDGGCCTAYPGPDLPCRKGGRRREGEEPSETARPLPVGEDA